MASAFQIQLAARHVTDGAVIAYPTEGVFGLGCAAADLDALERVILIKGRDAGKGLILLVAEASHLNGWVEIDTNSLPAPVAGKPITWVVPASRRCDTLITGDRATVAVRITDHPVARRLAGAVATPLVSTSANRSGQAAALSALTVRRTLGGVIDFLVPGALGNSTGPSEIRDFISGNVLRKGAASA